MFTKGPWYAEMPTYSQIRTLAKCEDRKSHDDVVACMDNSVRADDVILMAAAPDMYEALEFIISRNGGDLPAYMNPALHKAAAALRKAKGEQP